MHLKRPPKRDAQGRISRIRPALQASLHRCAWECGPLNVIGAKGAKSALRRLRLRLARLAATDFSTSFDAVEGERG
jgi:hypothetical protein